MQALLDGEIPAAELAPITTHLAGCEACRARLDELRALMGEADTLIQSLGDGAPASGAPARGAIAQAPPRLPVYRRLAWAATVLFAAGVGYWAGDPGPSRAAIGPVDAEVTLSQAPATNPPPAAEPMTMSEQATAGNPAPARPNAPAPAEGAASTERRAAPPPTAIAADARADTSAKVVVLGDSALIVRRAETILPDTSSLAGRRALGATLQALSERARQENRLAAGAQLREAAPSAPMALQRSGVAVEGFAPVGLTEAVAVLGGSLRLVDGLVPDRLEASSTTVRVIYPLREGELVLEQRLEGDSLRVSLRGPLSRDSLAVLRGRVR